MVLITRVVSLTNFVVASSALGFQVFVLYPWHKQLDEDFEALKKEHLRVLDAISDLRAASVRQAQNQTVLAAVQKQQQQTKSGLSSWWR